MQFCFCFLKHGQLVELVENRPVGREVTLSSLEWEVLGSNLGSVKSHTVLPTARPHYNISSNGAELPARDGPHKLVTRFSVIQRVQQKI